MSRGFEDKEMRDDDFGRSGPYTGCESKSGFGEHQRSGSGLEDSDDDFAQWKKNEAAQVTSESNPARRVHANKKSSKYRMIPVEPLRANYAQINGDGEFSAWRRWVQQISLMWLLYMIKGLASWPSIYPFKFSLCGELRFGLGLYFVWSTPNFISYFAPKRPKFRNWFRLKTKIRTYRIALNAFRRIS